MKKLFVFLMVVELIIAGGGKASVLASTIYELYATVELDTQDPVTDFYLRYNDRDGDQKFSLNELISFSGVGYGSTTYTQILEVPLNNFDSPYTDGPNPRIFYWYFKDPSHFNTTIYINPNLWYFDQVPVGSGVAVAVPGKTVVMDPEDDLLLRRCDPVDPDNPCSLPPCSNPPCSPPSLPGYFDIKSARITQLGGGNVDLSIQLSGLIPAIPPDGFVSYIWQFAGGCVTGEPGDKDAINVVWNYQDREWSAFWVKITQCFPREIEIDTDTPVAFQFTDDIVKVRVPLADLLTATDETGTLMWHAAVRRVPFIYYRDQVQITHTVAVDYAPDIQAFNPTPPPPIIQPEDFATWEPR